MATDFQLTGPQRRAIETRNKALLVAAAAGSGKTMVLVERLMTFLLDEKDPCDISEFLIITYTRAAAGELRNKIEKELRKMLNDNPNDRRVRRQLRHLEYAQISTIHSFCASILRDYAWLLDIPGDFRVGEENETALLRQSVADRVIKESYDEMTPEFQAFADRYSAGRNDRNLKELLLKLYVQASARADIDKWLTEASEMLERGRYADYSDTVWGQFLLDDLRSSSEEYVNTFEKLKETAEHTTGYENTAVSLANDISVLRQYVTIERWNDAHARLNFAFERIKAPKKNADLALKEKIAVVRASCKNQMKKKLSAFTCSSEEALAELDLLALPISGLVQLTKRFMDSYKKEKKRKRILDYSDLEHLSLELLYGKKQAGLTSAAGEIRKRYKGIFVDEYQDSNEIQDRIFTAVSKERKNLFLVGDVKQSIYGFRLADPGIFLKYYHAYPTIHTDDEMHDLNVGKGKVLLGENFRSRKEILEAANDVFRQNMTTETGGLDYGDEEALYPKGTFDDVSFNPVELHLLRTKQDMTLENDEGADSGESTAHEKLRAEARFTAARIENLLREGTCIDNTEKTLQKRDIAILLRSPSTEAAVYAEELAKRGIASCCDSGDNIMISSEIQFLTAWMEILKNPNQDIFLAAVLMSPVFSFTADDMAEIRCNVRKSGFYYAAQRTLKGNADGRLGEKLNCFFNAYRQMKYLTQRDGYAEALDRFLLEIHLQTLYGALKGGTVRGANIEYFRNMVRNAMSNGYSLWELCRWIHELEKKGVTGSEESSEDAVIITSIHKSKGLEYPVVILGMLSKAFNERDLREQFQMSSDLGIAANVADNIHKVTYPSVPKQAIVLNARKNLLSEEQRILYVAMTRPKHLLIMVYSDADPAKKLKSLLAAAEFRSKSGAAGCAGCMGDWVLLHALRRTEGEPLRKYIDAADGGTVFQYPWNICVHDTVNDAVPDEPAFLHTEEQTGYSNADNWNLGAIEKDIGYVYPYEEIGSLPAKITATQLKGRIVDQSLSNGAAIEPDTAPGTPRKLTKNTTSPLLDNGSNAAKRGTAIHNAMQFIKYEACMTREGVLEELERLVREEFLTREKADMIEPNDLLRFFESPIGRRIANADSVLREFKFSVLLPAVKWFPQAAGEQFLVQGVVDCCIFENGEMTVIDFKSDSVTERTEKERAETYRFQIETYSEALSLIFSTKVKERVVYFFRTGGTVTL